MKFAFAVVVTSALVAGPALASKDLAQKHACLACHAADKKIVGPAYQDVVKKYAGQKDVEQTLANGSTLSRTTFGLRQRMGCWWVRL